MNEFSPPHDYSIDIADRQTCLIPDEQRLRDAVRRVLTEEHIHSATIGLALVDDTEIHRVNREFLGHDYPTDVISFLLEGDGSQGAGGRSQESGVRGQESGQGLMVDGRGLRVRGSEERTPCLLPGPQPSTLNLQPHLEGELIVSTETALREAAAHGWSPQDEVLLYVVHGLLHLCGYDDLTDEARPSMRVREREVLAGWQLVPTGLEA